VRHRFHSLCPYFAMFPEAFAEKWIRRLTVPGDVVLDPFSGRGTTALCAVLAGRAPIASDVNDVAFCLTKAKTQAPSFARVRRRIAYLRRKFDERKQRHNSVRTEEFFKTAFSPRTLGQLLFLRACLRWRSSQVDCMVAALVLGVLHGESGKSSRYLSNQMPRTISTKPKYSVRFWRERGLVAPERDVFQTILHHAKFRYASPVPNGDSTVIHGDMRRLPTLFANWSRPVKCVITSPPYLDVTNFEEDQWLRLWFLGGPPHPTTNRLSRDDRHSSRASYWSFISDMWRSLGAILAPNSHVVIRIGSRLEGPKSLRSSLVGCARLSRRQVRLVSYRVSDLRNRQTRSFQPGTKGCLVETDFHFHVR
jgi:hypothetical protein